MLSVRLFVVIAIAIFSNTALGSPYSTTYASTIQNQNIDPHPDFALGESYSVTLVMDNGGASAASQQWTPAHLQCVIFEFNDARNVVFAQDLVADGNFTAVGNAVTDSSGVLANFFSIVFGGVSAGDATNDTSLGFTDLRDPVSWYLDGGNDVWYDDDEGRSAGDIDGGVQMNPGKWSAPTAFSGTCDATPAATATPVPALPLFGLLTLGGLLGLFGLRKLNK